MAEEVEDRSMGGGEFLKGGHGSKAPHRSLSPSEMQVRILDLVVLILASLMPKCSKAAR